MKTFLYVPGTRVRVKRGRFPLDPSLVGRTGLIVQLDDYRQERYGVVLDGGSELRDFAEEELVPLTDEEIHALTPGSTGPGTQPSPSGASGGEG